MTAVAVPALVVAAIGCSPATVPPVASKTATHEHDHDHEHGDHGHGDHAHGDHDDGSGDGHHDPTTFAGAVDAIGGRLESLEKAFADKDYDAADPLVHEIGHLLEDGEDLLDKAPEAIASKARVAWNDLGECLADVDEKLHSAGDDKTVVKDAYESVRPRIGSAMESLRGHVKSAGNQSDN